MEVNFESFIERTNNARNYVEQEIGALQPDIVNWKETSKKWSVLEVVSHLNQVYQLYLDNFEKVLKNAPTLSSSETNKKQSTLLGGLSAYSMKPKGKKRRFKMKTFDFFEPVSKAESPNETIVLFLENKSRFREIIEQSRLKDVKGIKIPTALGQKIKFYIPECIDFLMSHEERHIVQIEGILDKLKSGRN